MPELPEVETVRRGLQPVMEGQRIARVETRREGLRFPFQKDFVARLEGKVVSGLGRRAKYLMADMESGDVLLMHLGMSGSFRVILPEGESTPGDFHYPRSENRTHDHVVFHMASGAMISFNDPRRFGYMKIVPRTDMEAEPLLRGLGPEPLGNEFDAAMLAQSCAGKKTSLKAALLDQRVVAGLGNIYVCEALYRARISPLIAAGKLTRPRLETLAAVIRDVLNDAIIAGGSTLKDFANVEGGQGYFQHRFDVYGREGEPCRAPECSGVVARVVQAGRSTFYCPSCQKK